MSLNPFIPQDRLRAIAHGQSLPDRTNGSVLFADISGFTPLTESLNVALGPRQGAEALSQHLDTVFTALIAEIEGFGGSVIGFAGDSITCWFDDSLGKAAPRAAAAAFAMQTAMEAFTAIPIPDSSTTALSLKVALATGPARRFAVGDPKIGLLDTLAGATVTRTSTAEHLAKPGEVLLDEATVKELGGGLSIDEWRKDEDSDEHFAVASIFTGDVKRIKRDPLPEIPPEHLQPWLLQAVFARELSGQGGFLTEFRPCTALFVRFLGIDYDAGVAEEQLDDFIRQTQALVHEADGALLQLTIGDKGSYAYINFGALSAHEDDPRRAVRAARTLLKVGDALGFLAPLQIGIAHGVMRVGTYGGHTRQAYGGQGDDVNLAARLMQTAAPGEILLSSRVHKATTQDFVFEPRPPLPIKGKAEPLPIFAVTGERRRRAIRLQEPTYALPMVGRQFELEAINAKLDLALAGQAQVIGIVAEAGIGKSRLVAEVIRSARKKGFTGYGGACQSDGIHTPYLAWKSIWQAFFDVDPVMPSRKLIRWLEGEIEDRAPTRMEALPLLGALLDVNIPDSDFSRTLEPKIRKKVLHALLEDCLKAAVQEEPLLIVIEDLHWIDALSYDLLNELANSLANFPVCFLLAYRPPQTERLLASGLQGLPHFTRIELHDLSKAEAEQAIRAKLAQLYPACRGAVPPKLIEKLMTRSQGNPFYLEELLNFLRDRGLDPRDPADLERIELPDSLHSLILSRIDQLTESERITLRVASIVGRLFRARWLTGYYPELGDLPQVKADLDELDALDITPLDSPEPDLAYLFKHIVTHEVTYENLPFATRSKLHEQLARYLERAYPNSLPLEALAFHYGRSENAEKALAFYTMAGDSAFRLFALEGALTNYERAIDWADRGKAGTQEIIHLYQRRGRTLELLLRHTEALETYQALEALGQGRDDDALQLAGIVAQSFVYGYGLADMEKGRQRSEEALALARKLGDRRTEARSLWNLMRVLTWVDPVNALAYGESGLVVARELTAHPQATNEDLEQLALILLDFSFPLIGNGQIELARERTVEAQKIFERVGNLPMVATAGQRLGVAFKDEGRLEQAEAAFKQSIAIDQSIGNEGGLVGTSVGLLDLYPFLGDYASFFAVLEAAKPIVIREGRFPAELIELFPILAYSYLGAIDQVRQLAATLFRFYETGMAIWPSVFLAYALLAHIRAGELGIARDLLDRIETDVGMENFLSPLAYLVPQAKAEWALATGNLDEGLVYVDEFLLKARQKGVQRHIPAKLLVKGRILQAAGRPEEAFAVLNEAYSMATEQKARPVLWQICALLGEMEAGSSNLAVAQKLYEQAREIIDFIAEHAGRDDLRASFLAIPQVQLILTNTGRGQD